MDRESDSTKTITETSTVESGKFDWKNAAKYGGIAAGVIGLGTLAYAGFQYMKGGDDDEEEAPHARKSQPKKKKSSHKRKPAAAATSV